jgi:hypothetical protein
MKERSKTKIRSLLQPCIVGSWLRLYKTSDRDGREGTLKRMTLSVL